MVFTRTKLAEWCTLTQLIFPLVRWNVKQTRYFGSPSLANRSYSRVSCARAVSGTVLGNAYRMAYPSNDV